MKDQITIIINYVKHHFYADELTSAEQKAIEFLKKLDEDKREF